MGSLILNMDEFRVQSKQKFEPNTNTSGVRKDACTVHLPVLKKVTILCNTNYSSAITYDR